MNVATPDHPLVIDEYYCLGQIFSKKTFKNGSAGLDAQVGH
jgi:hypothetical protein